MPQERRNRSISIDRSAMAERSSSSFKDWEQPHNTVLLICSSHDKGCRHSNCLDLYRKAFDASALENGSGSPVNLTCPLCRGVVSDWKVVQTARKYLNTKVRNCSTETCGFSGAYGELRKHARTEHPFVRPSEVDSERQQDWRRMELQGDLGSGRRQGGTARALSEENFSESEAYGRFQRNDEDAGDDESYDDDAGHEEALDEDDSV